MDESRPDILKWLLMHARDPHLETWKTKEDWLRHYHTLSGQWPSTIERAVVGGVLSDRMAWAFASGYQAALQCMFPDVPDGKTAAFCVSEKDGNHPKAILTRLEPSEGGFVLNGQKAFVTGALDADLLFVAASVREKKEGKNPLKMVRVKNGADGLVATPMPPLPFIPELPHCTLLFENAWVSAKDVCPGDGYLDYVKPFRTLEDIHVCAAVSGFAFRMGIACNWPRHDLEQVLSLVLMVCTLPIKDPLSPALHIVLGGVFSHLERLVARIPALITNADNKTRKMWERDAPVLKIAAKARKQRLSTAWATVRRN